MTVNLQIFRFNADFDYQPHYQHYELEISEKEVVLDILNRIKADIDPTLSYRRSCRHGICGSCAVTVNNKSVLACKENIYQLVQSFGETLIIDPLDKRKAVRDLIIDKTDFWSSYRAVQPWLKAPISPAPAQEHLITPKIAAKIDGADGCVQCGVCYYSCPSVRVNERFLGPAALTKLYRFAADVRDNANRQRLDTANAAPSGIWECVKCMECHAACPKELSPVTKIAKLRQMTFASNNAPNTPATRHALAFKHSIVKFGRLDENANVRYSLGNFGALKHTKEAIKMLLHRKLPLKTPPISKLEEVRTLVALCEEAP